MTTNNSKPTPSNSELEKEIDAIITNSIAEASDGELFINRAKLKRDYLALIHTETQRAVEQYKQTLEFRIAKDSWFADNDRDRVYLQMREATFNHKEKKS